MMVTMVTMVMVMTTTTTPGGVPLLRLHRGAVAARGGRAAARVLGRGRGGVRRLRLVLLRRPVRLGRPRPRPRPQV